MTLVTVPCDICGGTVFRPVYAGTIRDDSMDPAAYYSSSRSRAGYLPIVRCCSCGLVMTNPRDDDATLARVYESIEDRVYDAEDDNRSSTAYRYFALVTRYQSSPARLLDVGCATGMFISAAYKAGWQVVGLEASKWAVARARERCPAATFVTGLLGQVGWPASSFDVITCWDVLEHMSRPLAALHRLHGWLAPGGWLFLNVPNFNSLIARLMGKRWVLLLREHLWYFSPATMAALLHNAGFELLCTRPHFVRFSVANVLARLSQYPGLGNWLGRRLRHANALRRLFVEFSMGEMTVVARKVEPGPITHS